MPLADYQAPRQIIQFAGGSFEVHGVSLRDLENLIRAQLVSMDEIQALVSRYVVAEGINAKVASAIGFEIIQSMPALAAHIIAVGAGEPDMADKAEKLPLYVQFAALEAIARLTFEDFAGLKRMMATAQNLIGAARPLIESPPESQTGQRPSVGTGDSGRPPPT